MRVSRVCTFGIVSVLCLSLCLAMVLAFVPSYTAAAYDSYYQQTPGFDDSVFTDLDYGLYWYDEDSRIPVRAGTEGANFDPDKPTIIFTHGMKINEGYNRRDLVSLWAGTNGLFESAGYEPYMYYDEYYQILLQMGYNVGHFYWNQLAEISTDEDYRIWTSDLYDEEGNDVGLSYFVSNAKGKRTLGDPTKNPHDSVAVLFGEAIKAGLGADYNQPWRLVGHSMGGQLVLATTQNLIYQNKTGAIGQNLLPERVSLVDPYMCNTETVEGMRIDHLGGKAIPAGTWTADLCADAMEDIAAADIALDAYGGTQMVYRNYMGMNEANIESVEIQLSDAKRLGMSNEYIAEVQATLDALVANRTRYAPLTARIGNAACWTHLDAIGQTYGAQSHCMIIDYYFTTMYEDDQTDNYGVQLPSVDSSTEYIRNLRGYNFMQVARAGSEENPFYRHTTDFIRVDVECNPIKNILSGSAEGFETVSILDVDDNVIQTASVDKNGKYTFYNVDNGVYTVRYQAGNRSETAPLTVDSAKDGKTITIPAITPDVKSDVKTLVYILIAPAVLIVVMVIAIIVACRTIKKAKQDKDKA